MVSLRVRMWQKRVDCKDERTSVCWSLAQEFVFHGADRKEAQDREVALRRMLPMYSAAVAGRPWAGLRWMVRARWIE